MIDLRVAPWQGHGEDRLDVITESGTRVAWFDRGSGRIEIEDEWYRDAVLDALAPYLRGGPARQLPAAALPGTRGGVLARLFRSPAAAGPAEPEPGDEAGVVGRLARLTRRGWRLLHPVPVSGADDAHVVIGPAGVFLISTVSHPGARVLVGARVVSVDGHQHSYPRAARHQATKVAKLLTAACGFPVSVTPVLAFAGAASVKSSAPTPEMLATRGEDIDRLLARLPTRLNAATSDRIYAAAQAQHTWLAGT